MLGGRSKITTKQGKEERVSKPVWTGNRKPPLRWVRPFPPVGRSRVPFVHGLLAEVEFHTTKTKRNDYEARLNAAVRTNRPATSHHKEKGRCATLLGFCILRLCAKILLVNILLGFPESKRKAELNWRLRPKFFKTWILFCCEIILVLSAF